jgi:hypothetical protein
MSGRRRYPRYVLSNNAGTLKILNDVTVQADARGHLIAVGDQPRTCGEMLTVELANGTLLRRAVLVAEVRPIVDGGSIRHWSRLVPVEVQGRSTTGGHTDSRLGVETG